MSLSAGTRLGAYEIVAPLGAGGMAEVYRARDLRLGREVALKVLPPDVTADPGRVERFDREARAIAALNHPHIVTIYSTEAADGLRFLTMELVEGLTLERSIVTGGLTVARFLEIAIPLADALTAAHQQQITHRDLKPGNVMISNQGRVKVLDFGLARIGGGITEPGIAETQAPITHHGMIVGTMPYMSPEQVEGRPLDPRSDLFSLGVIFHELLSGVRPFTGTSSAALLSAILRDTPPSLADLRGDVPAPLVRLITRCLQKSPHDRVQTARDVHNELRQVQREVESGPRPRPDRHHPPPSIAVLPFANMSADRDNEYFSDGLSEEIINALTRISGVKVTARTSAFSFRGKDLPIDEIARRLGVDHIVEGSVRKAGDRIRVTAQLVKAADGFRVWSERYDRALTDVFAIQDEMAAAIASQLKVRLLPSTRSGRTPHLGAYEAFLQSRHHWYKLTPAALEKSRELVERALALDPEYADAYVGLAAYHFGMAWFGNADPRVQLPRGLEAARRALTLDPESADAQSVAGAVTGVMEFDWQAARVHHQRALAIDRSPHVVLAHALWFLRQMGQLEDARVELAGLCDSDPLAAFPRSELAHLLLLMRRYDDAAESAQQALDLEPDYLLAAFTLLSVRLLQDRVDEATAIAERIVLVSGRWLIPLAFLGLAYAAAGQVAEVVVIRDEMLALAERTHVNATALATIHVALGEIDEAMRWLERAVEQREPIITTLASWPIFDAVRSHPRYRDLLVTMRLPQP